MPHVPAGNITGVYYIIVAGLPWACSWQRLKDFARNLQPDGKCIDIDHAMVYPDSTDGWVRVKGRENFLRAFKHLNGGILDDRSLLADGRNETETQTLRDWTTTWPANIPYRERNSSSGSSHTYSSSASASRYSSPPVYTGSEIEWHYQQQHASQGYGPASPTYSSFSYYPQSPGYEGPSSPIFASPASQYPVSPTSSAIVYTSNVVTSAQLMYPQQVYTYAVPYMTSAYSNTCISPTSPPAPSVIKTEARKIIITQLPHGTTTAALHELLTTIISSSKRLSNISVSPVQSIELATHVDGKPKGHAFATFETHAIAKNVAKEIKGLRFQGRVLDARLAKEGAEPSSRYGGKHGATSSTELLQFSEPVPVPGAQWWGYGDMSKATAEISEHRAAKDSGKGRSGSKPQTNGKDGGESMVVSSDGEAVGKRSGAMSAPAVVDGSSHRSSHGKDKKHRS